MNQNQEINSPLSMDELLANLGSVSRRLSSLGQILEPYELSNRNFSIFGTKRLLTYPEQLAAQHRGELLEFEQEFQRTKKNGRVAYNSAFELAKLSEDRDEFLQPQHHPMGAAPLATKVIQQASKNPYSAGIEKVNVMLNQISNNLGSTGRRIFNLEKFDENIREQKRLIKEQEELEKLNKLIEKMDEAPDRAQEHAPRPRKPSHFQEARARARSKGQEVDDEINNVRSNTPSPTR